MRPPRVSVIVPAYNAQEVLPTAIESVLAQTYGDWELIVADDASTDATADVARQYGERVRLVAHARNSGLAATRNLALAQARGELVAFLDSDDAWLPEYLAEQTELFDRERSRDPRVAIACCDARLIAPDGSSGATYSQRFGAPPEHVGPAALLRANRIFVSVLASRAAVQEAGGFDSSLRRVEDLDLWLRLVERGHRVVYNPRVLALYRLGHDSLSRDALAMARARQAVYRKALDRGRLDAPARREARRALRLERAAETVESLRRSARRRPLRSLAAAAMAAPFVASVLIERAAISLASRARSSRRRRRASASGAAPSRSPRLRG